MTYVKKYSQLISCFFLVVMWIIPDHISPWGTFLQDAFACIGFLFLWGGHKFIFIPIRIYIVIFLLICTSLFQYGIGVIGLGDFVFLILISAYFCMNSASGAAEILDKRNYAINDKFSRLDIVFFSVLVGALANSVVALSQWQSVESGMLMYPSNGRAYGNLAQPNQLATLLLMALVALIYFDINKKIRNIWLYIAAAILVFTLVATQSRTGALSITALVAVILSIRNFRNMLRWVIPCLLFYWVAYINWGFISSKFGGSPAREFSGISSTRYKLWEQMYAAISESPLIGWGWLNLGAAQQDFAVIIGGAENMDHAHNLFLDLIIWFGLPAGGIIVAALIFWMLRIFYVNIFIKGNDESEVTAQCALLFILPIAIHSMLEYPFAYMYFMLPCVFFMGVIECSEESLKMIPLIFQKILWAFISLSAGLSFLVGKEYLQLESDFKSSLLEEQFFTKESELHQYKSSPFILNQYQELVSVLRINISSNIDEKNLEAARVISKRFPWFITMNKYYLLLLKMEKCDEAKNQKLLIESFFGRFGTVKSDDYIIKYNLIKKCNYLIKSDFPPFFSSTRTPSITIPLSTALHIS